MILLKEQEFASLIRPLLEDPRAQEMKKYIQHGTITTFDHCYRVAYMAYVLNERLHMEADKRRLVRAAFLHDYFLYDWHNHGDHLHGYHHPDIAAFNAGRDFNLDELEQAAIRSHMWPLTLFHPPLSREGWLITLSDKICSARETVMMRRARP